MDLGGFAINGLWPPPPDGEDFPDSTDSLSLGSIAPIDGVHANIGPTLLPAMPPGNLYYKYVIIL